MVLQVTGQESEPNNRDLVLLGSSGCTVLSVEDSTGPTVFTVYASNVYFVVFINSGNKK